MPGHMSPPPEPQTPGAAPTRTGLMLPVLAGIALAAATAPALAAFAVGENPAAGSSPVHVDLARAVHGDILIGLLHRHRTATR